MKSLDWNGPTGRQRTPPRRDRFGKRFATPVEWNWPLRSNGALDAEASRLVSAFRRTSTVRLSLAFNSGSL